MRVISPKETNEFVKKLLVKINSKTETKQVPVKVEPYAELRNCFYNVEEKVKRDGGAVHYGWKVFQTDSLCEAERHAVWEDLTGNFIDITPNEDKFEQIMFIPDNNLVYEGQLIDNIRVNITDNLIVDDFIYLCEKTELIYNYGHRVDSTQMSLPQPALELLSTFQELKSTYLDYIHAGGKPNKPCYCGKSKNYRNCHGKKFRREIESALEILNRVIKNEY